MFYKEKSGNSGVFPAASILHRPQICPSTFPSLAGLPDFYWYNIPKREKIYQNNLKIYQMAQNKPYGYKIKQIGHKIYQHLQLQDPPKFTQIRIFGLKYAIWQP
jgi:hypothetical protein